MSGETSQNTDAQTSTMTASASEGTMSSGTATQSSSDSSSATGDVTMTAASESDTGTGTDTDTDTGTDTDTDTTTGEIACDNEGKEGFDFSYLWVANTDQGSISKINTETKLEEARYYSDLSQTGVSSPSRTSVNITGRFVVVSNRGTGWVTKVAANITDCVDMNGNGMIETSPNKDTLLPWGSDECVLWSTQVIADPFSIKAGPRGTAWTPGTYNPETCEYEDQKVWVGWLKAPGQAVMGMLNGDTGELEATVPIPNWPLTGDDGLTGFAPYGAAVDADGFVWTTAAFSDQLYRIDPKTMEYKNWSAGGGASHYGMTVDSKGKVWLGNWLGHGGVSTFDPVTETFTVIPGSTNNANRGIAVGADGNVWVVTNESGASGCGMIQIDAETQTVVQFHQFPQCGGYPVGVSVDVAGFVWMVDNDWVYKINPVTYEKEQVLVANSHYTYSDMTGGGLFNAVIPQ